MGYLIYNNVNKFCKFWKLKLLVFIYEVIILIIVIIEDWIKILKIDFIIKKIVKRNILSCV